MRTNFACFAVVASLSLAVAGSALANDGAWNDLGRPTLMAANDGHDHAKDGHDHGTEHGHDDKGHFEGKSFASIKEAWSFIATSVTEAEKLATDKKFETLHEIGEHIASAIHVLEDKSDMITGDAKTKLASALKQLDKAADELHHASEKGDSDAITLNLKKLKGLLPLVQGLYPPGTL